MPGFATTRWSLILKSGRGPDAARDALLVRLELLQTVADPESLDKELRELRHSFDAEPGEH